MPSTCIIAHDIWSLTRIISCKYSKRTFSLLSTSTVIGKVLRSLTRNQMSMAHIYISTQYLRLPGANNQKLNTDAIMNKYKKLLGNRQAYFMELLAY